MGCEKSGCPGAVKSGFVCFGLGGRSGVKVWFLVGWVCFIVGLCSILFLGWLEKIYKNIGWVFLEAVMGLETGLDNFAPSSPDHLPPKRHKTGLNRTLGIQIFRQTVTPSNALHLCSFSWHTAAIVCKME